MKKASLLTCLTYFCLASNLVSAQCCPGDLHGRITDTRGNLVAGATVSVHDCEKDSKPRVALSDAKGKFQIVPMAWGPCVVTVTARGFRPYEQTGIRGIVDGDAEFNAVLER
jgi:hypothetical protein